MRTYTVHMPREARSDDPLSYERALLVRDGFNWVAFFFSVLWMLWHRLWLAALLTAIVLFAVSLGLEAIGLGEGASLLVTLLVAVLIGLEGSTLRRWTYARRGMPVSDVVLAIDHEQADARACARWLARTAVPPPIAAAPPAAPPPPPPSVESDPVSLEKPPEAPR